MSNYVYVEITNGKDFKTHRLEGDALTIYRNAEAVNLMPVFPEGTFPYGYRYIHRNLFQRMPKPVQYLVIGTGVLSVGLLAYILIEEIKESKTKKKLAVKE